MARAPEEVFEALGDSGWAPIGYSEENGIKSYIANMREPRTAIRRPGSQSIEKSVVDALRRMFTKDGELLRPLRTLTVF